jgi:hypothetical protein
LKISINRGRLNYTVGIHGGGEEEYGVVHKSREVISEMG